MKASGRLSNKMMLYRILGLFLSSVSIAQSADPTANLIPIYGSDLVASSSGLSPAMSGLDMLRMAVPGNPGEDYPVYAEVPSTGFSCSGRVEGGYYADPEADCQPFHVCSADSSGGLAKVSFLCPNGTLFNQETFVCEYWFNVDCSQAESFYSLNDNIGAVEQKDGLASAASSPQRGYASPSSSPQGGYASPSSSPQSGYSAPSQVERQGRLINRNRPSKPRPTSRKPNKQSVNVSVKPALSKFEPRGSELNTANAQQLIDRSKTQSRIGGSPGPKNHVNRQQNFSPRTERITKENSPLKIDSSVRQSKRRPIKKAEQTRPSNTGRRTKTTEGKKKTKGKRPRKGRQEVNRGYLPPIGGPAPPADSYAAGSSADYDYQEAPFPAGDSTNANTVEDLTDAVYQEDELPTYNNGVYTNGNTVAGSSYSAPIADSIAPSDSDFDEDILPAYNNGVYNNAGADVSEVDGTSYVAPSDDSFGSPKESSDAFAAADYEEDELPTYNNGVYFDGKTVAGSSYTAPVADSINPNDSDFDEDILPAYNNGVYNNADAGAEEGTSYVAPSPANFVPNSYLPPSDTAESPESQSGSQSDILPEYFKSEISLGLSDPLDVPRVEPFLSDYGASGSSPVGVVVSTPPVISLEDYNIQEVSDKGFPGLASGSYGR